MDSLNPALLRFLNIFLTAQYKDTLANNASCNCLVLSVRVQILPLDNVTGRRDGENGLSVVFPTELPLVSLYLICIFLGVPEGAI